MFVLISTGEGVMTCDASVKAFATHKEAHEVMEREILHWTKVVEEYDDDEMESVVIEENEAYDGSDPDSMTWHIFEMPGLFVPQEEAGWVKACLRDFGVGQTNFEASEMALDVCNVLKKYA